MSVLNSTILERAFLSGSWDYQQRVGNPSIIGYASCVENLFAPMNGDMYNEFCHLLNGLVATYVDIRRFDNPLSFIKKPASDWKFGFSERHLVVHFMEQHSPRFDEETLLKVEPSKYEEWFYSLNYEARYEFSWSRYEMKQAFSGDGYGFEDLLAANITQMYSSANYDEMNTMINAFAEADNRLGGIYRYHLSAEPSDEATAKELLKGIRAVAGRMKFPSNVYNHLPVPVHTDGSRLVLYVLPETLASIDVDALAAVFQLKKADPSEVLYRIVEVPYFPIPDVYAILADEDFIYWRDYMTGMEPPFYNPGNRTTKYYYYQSAAVGVNPAAPAVAFSTDAATTVPTITETVTGIEFAPDSGTVEAGGTLKMFLNLLGTLANSDGGETGVIGVEPDAATFELSAVDNNSAAFNLNTRTYVDKNCVLHVQKSIPVGSVITVTATAAYINPSGSTSTYTDTFTATVV